jgi:hypothetical protein
MAIKKFITENDNRHIVPRDKLTVLCALFETSSNLVVTTNMQHKAHMYAIICQQENILAV